MSGRLAKWAVEISALTLDFKPRTSTKDQVIADFIAEIPPNATVDPSELNTNNTKYWNLYTDGASNKDGAGIGILLVHPDGKETTHAIKLSFKTSNNETEYEALIACLKLTIAQKVTSLRAHADSQLIANQINLLYEAKEDSMSTYLVVCQRLMKNFKDCEVLHIPRGENKKADALSKLASCFEKPDLHIETLDVPMVFLCEVLETTRAANLDDPTYKFLKQWYPTY